jgi:hypothetical protein
MRVTVVEALDQLVGEFLYIAEVNASWSLFIVVSIQKDTYLDHHIV